ncbi:uncharacterized protein L969DRAFT_46612 [Mixia osmundae IAM 14324]|uniref:Uncharacterized protein n=1 Tax=Mixia osmundae (strain CBS 9802 / IAM 14324 / JCM 22182 / KY 12970) TaxID=764103 RepID=G7E5X1_MIXOS|nr:uncharacterized protein L969DRAFT_46612 [Mixia osmundae IAM 14324]KEI40617.1 hypothetical protein L969DRAFT_46612 [Mixia osmundae IAM 14324]GAA98231.1 hypothetical protein E5Q_04914 [Mixia osmundae IAM 14324]
MLSHRLAVASILLAGLSCSIPTKSLPTSSPIYQLGAASASSLDMGWNMLLVVSNTANKPLPQSNCVENLQPRIHHKLDARKIDTQTYDIAYTVGGICLGLGYVSWPETEPATATAIIEINDEWDIEPTVTIAGHNTLVTSSANACLAESPVVACVLLRFTTDVPERFKAQWSAEALQCCTVQAVADGWVHLEKKELVPHSSALIATCHCGRFPVKPVCTVLGNTMTG